MKAPFPVLICALLPLAAGCATGRRPPSTGTESPPRYPEATAETGRAVAEARASERTALPLDAQVPPLSYEIRQHLSRPPRLSGRLDAPLGRRWEYIVIHHSATLQGSESEFDEYHRKQKNWLGVGYDFVIGNGRGSSDGLVEVTFRWERQMDGAHAASQGNEYNRTGIGICLVGDFEKGYPTARQMEALVGLVNYLQERCTIPTRNIMGHRHVPGANTKCPGQNFPWYEFLSLLEH